MIKFSCYDSIFTIDGPAALLPLLEQVGFEPETGEAAEEALLSFRLEEKGSYYNLVQGDVTVSQEQTLPLLCEIITSRVHRSVCAACSEVTFLRGDAVRQGDRASVLVGADFSGQTRLAQALLDEGAEVWSRHFVALNDAGEFLPYPATSVPTSSLKTNQILQFDYRPQSGFEASIVSPGVASLHLLTLVRGGDNAIPQAMPRVALACRAAEVLYKGQRGEATGTLEALRTSGAESSVAAAG